MNQFRHSTQSSQSASDYEHSALITDVRKVVSAGATLAWNHLWRLGWARHRPIVRTTLLELATPLRGTKPAAAKWIKELVEAGLVTIISSTKGHNGCHELRIERATEALQPGPRVVKGDPQRTMADEAKVNQTASPGLLSYQVSRADLSMKSGSSLDHDDHDGERNVNRQVDVATLGETANFAAASARLTGPDSAARGQQAVQNFSRRLLSELPKIEEYYVERLAPMVVGGLIPATEIERILREVHTRARRGQLRVSKPAYFRICVANFCTKHGIDPPAPSIRRSPDAAALAGGGDRLQQPPGDVRPA